MVNALAQLEVRGLNVLRIPVAYRQCLKSPGVAPTRQQSLLGRLCRALGAARLAARSKALRPAWHVVPLQ